MGNPISPSSAPTSGLVQTPMVTPARLITWPWIRYFNALGGGTTIADMIAAGTAQALSATPSAPGNFTLAHGLGATPTAALIMMTSGGAIWFQVPLFDSVNVYLVSSAAGLTAQILVML